MKGLDAFDEMLRTTLEDGVLSRGEDRVLRMVLSELAPDERELDVLAARAFEVAEEALDREAHREVLRWLKRVLAAIRSAEQADASAAAPPIPAEAWFSPEQDCVDRIRGIIGEARRRLDICVFTITDDRLTKAIEKAHRNGVQIRVLSDDDKSGDLGSDIERLDRGGVKVRVDRSPYHMHHKFMVIDAQRVLTGSYNWTRSAARDNEENFVIVSTPHVVTAFSEEFERLWRLHA